MNNKFNGLARFMAQRCLTLGIALSVAVAFCLPNTTSALQGSVPLLVIRSASDSSDSTASHPRGQTGDLIYVHPWEITYPQVVQGMTIAGPAGPDIQVNDPLLDNIQYPVSSDPYPWEFATESETALAVDGANIVVGYNSSANRQIVKYTGNVKIASSHNGNFTYWYTGAYSVSHDGGRTWKNGVLPPPPGSIATWGDPMMAKDRAGNFYYSNQGQDAAGNYGLILSKSTDHGDTFSPAIVVALDPNSDKPWMAIGPDPSVTSRDNIYVTWTSGGSSLMFSRSTDGGATWSAPKSIFSYTDDGVFSSTIQGSTPTVDSSNGRLYVAFVNYGSATNGLLYFRTQDYVRLLASDDGGNTFSPVAFNIPGAPDAHVIPKVPAGFRCDQGVYGANGLPVIKQGPDIGGGLLTKQYGIARYARCSRIMGQPAAVAQNAGVVVAFEASTSAAYGDPASQSQIVALYSKDGGDSWFSPFVVAAATSGDPQHVMPALALAPNGNTVYAGYYVQDSNEQLRTELATLQLTGGGLLAMGHKPLSSVRFDLEPNNFPSPFASLKSLDSVNFDRSINAGYALGEYMSVAVDAAGNPMAAWGDCRNTWVSPANGLYPGAHPQTDVFFVKP